MKSCADQQGLERRRTIDWIDEVTLFHDSTCEAGVASTHRARLNTTTPPRAVRSNAASDMADQDERSPASINLAARPPDRCDPADKGQKGGGVDGSAGKRRMRGRDTARRYSGASQCLRRRALLLFLAVSAHNLVTNLEVGRRRELAAGADLVSILGVSDASGGAHAP